MPESLQHVINKYLWVWCYCFTVLVCSLTTLYFSILLVAEPFLVFWFVWSFLFVCLPVFCSFFFLFLFWVGGCAFSCPCHEFVCFSAEIRQEWGQLCSAAHVQSHTNLVSWYSMFQTFLSPSHMLSREPHKKACITVVFVGHPSFGTFPLPLLLEWY